MAFAWLFLATVVDASDGWLARRFRVREAIPHFDGGKLDDLVDYLTLRLRAGRDRRRGGDPASSTGPSSSPARCCWRARTGSRKTTPRPTDHFFTGFPSYWNIVVFYLYAAGTPAPLNAAVLLLLAALVFVPIRYVYPTRTPALLGWTVGLGLAWSASMLWMIWRLPVVSRPVLLGSLVFPTYYAVLSFVLDARRAAMNETFRVSAAR